MALSKLDQLYRQVILDYSQHPKNYGIINKEQGHTIELHNPTCGDVIELQIELDQQDIITQARFAGYGCTISKASASMMTVVIIGKTVNEALAMCEEFSLLVQGERIDDRKLGDAAMLAGVAKFPARIKCATLAWKALERMITTELNEKIMRRSE